MKKQCIDNKFFKLAHVEVAFRSRDKFLLEKITNWLKCFEQPSIENVQSQIQFSLISLEQGQKIPFIIPAEAKKTFENHNARYFSYKNIWIVEFQNSGLVIVNRKNYKMVGFVYTHYIYESIWNFEDFFHPMFELIRQKKLYQYHSAAVSYGEKGLLLPGKSGQGKTTLSIHLLDQGFYFLSDDRCYLKDEDHGNNIEIYGFYEPLRVFSSNISHIQKLEEFKNTVPDSTNKHPLDIQELYQEKLIPKCNLSAIIFPQWSPGSKSKIETVNAGKALIELLPQTVVCFDELSTRDHFLFCAKLTSTLPCARLFMGDDRKAWHELVISFISKNKE